MESPADARSSTTDDIEIACDESGSDGENLLASQHRVFAHGSVDVSFDDAAALVADVRRTFRVGAPELKAARLLREPHIDDAARLFDEGGPLYGRAHFFLIDKVYFAVSKIIDLLIEEEAHTRGLDMYQNGLARQMATTLFRYGRIALGGPNWERLIGAFVSLIRRRQRTGTKTTLEEFFAIVDDVRLRSHRSDVTQVLGLIWSSRNQAAQYDPRSNDYLDQPNLEPILAALHPTAAHWAQRHGRGVRLVHDRQTIVTQQMTDLVVRVANNPHPDLPFHIPLVGITQVDSTSDPRIQLADLTAGFGRLVGELALWGSLPGGLVAATRSTIDANCIWNDEASWRALTGRPVGG